MFLCRFAAALQEAAQVDKLIEEETGGEEVLEDRLPLLGVPLSVKESFSLQGNIQKSNLLPPTLVTYMSLLSETIFDTVNKNPPTHLDLTATLTHKRPASVLAVYKGFF